MKALLKDDGVMLLHAIGRMEPPGGTNTWLRKYIFPGGYTPALSEVLTAIEKVGLWVTDVEILRRRGAGEGGKADNGGERAAHRSLLTSAGRDFSGNDP